MFGYVRASKPELKVKEYEMYKAVYCSLCRYLGREYGLAARMTLNYDFTFLSLLIMAQKDGFDGTEHKACVCNPFKKCTYCKDCSSSLDIPAAALVILTKYKIDDNIADERGLKKLGGLLLKPLFKKPFKKAAKKYPLIAQATKRYVAAQTALETAGCHSLDEAAAPSGKVLSELFVMSGAADNSRALAELGDKIGRWIYIMDALCDFEEDSKKGRYNPLTGSDDCRERARASMAFCIVRARAAFELLQIKKFRDILGNILYVGLDDIMEKELTKV